MIGSFVVAMLAMIAAIIWRANKRWSHAERLLAVGRSAIGRGESPISVGAEMVAESQTLGCEEELKVLASEELPDLKQIWGDE
jgi:hypothetical protein